MNSNEIYSKVFIFLDSDPGVSGNDAGAIATIVENIVRLSLEEEEPILVFPKLRVCEMNQSLLKMVMKLMIQYVVCESDTYYFYATLEGLHNHLRKKSFPGLGDESDIVLVNPFMYGKLSNENLNQFA